MVQPRPVTAVRFPESSMVFSTVICFINHCLTVLGTVEFCPVIRSKASKTLRLHFPKTPESPARPSFQWLPGTGSNRRPSD